MVTPRRTDDISLPKLIIVKLHGDSVWGNHIPVELFMDTTKVSMKYANLELFLTWSFQIYPFRPLHQSFKTTLRKRPLRGYTLCAFTDGCPINLILKYVNPFIFGLEL